MKSQFIRRDIRYKAVKLYSEVLELVISKEQYIPLEIETITQKPLIDITKRLPLPENGEEIMGKCLEMEEEINSIEQNRIDTKKNLKGEVENLESEVSELKRRRHRLMEELRKVEDEISQKETQIKKKRDEKEKKMITYDNRLSEIREFLKVG